MVGKGSTSVSDKGVNVGSFRRTGRRWELLCSWAFERSLFFRSVVNIVAGVTHAVGCSQVLPSVLGFSFLSYPELCAEGSQLRPSPGCILSPRDLPLLSYAPSPVQPVSS